jgi:putative flippase GtrA
MSAAASDPTPVLEVVVPVHCEEHTVAACVRRLHDHLVHTFPYPFRITVADNASTDATVATARAVAAELPGVRVVELAEKGRGRALRRSWLASDAEVVAYVDVDLSTDLDALWPLVAPLLSGHSDLAIGSRLAHGSRVVRGLRREVISRGYNLLLRALLGARFTDAQCGFKAIRADVAAERCRLRIHEVPVDWYDDPDSRVAIVGTALDDLRGIRRLRRSLAAGALPVSDLADRLGRHTPTSGSAAATLRQAGRFAVVGAVSTVVHLGLFALLEPALGSAQAANLLALLLATLVNTALNRSWTFGVRGRRGAARHQAQGLAVFALTWALTSGALAGLHWVVATPSTAVSTTVLAGATAASTVLRFAAMRSWIFRPGVATPDGSGQYSVRMNEPSSSSNTTTPVQS